MANYIDGFVLPVPRDQLQRYGEVAEKVAKIWKEYGALEYFEYISDDAAMEGTRSFTEVVNSKEDEAVIFGWVVFTSREARDLANEKVAADPRMTDLVSPLVSTARPIFDAKKMVYGGFRSLV
ncbi:DUF1428 domain-containing protein [Marinicella litoralis]|uniref:Uncharacterized protein YbaA (DUF1428 family) n=1 Tax=Marinicella litoralis TaxID=644220 RepID=A0A4R6XVT8_9GAMM|nr:DUF1428 domain-containing protein [Marinicella litoralis]TDR20588.1 uncharacterized protein YbaA (DUF1428 family) [Marinicella litoralis]